MMRFATGAVLAAISFVPVWAAQVPRPAPEFVIKMPRGAQELLSRYKGKVVCVEFLYTTCPHCQTASQLMSRLQTEYGPKGFQALGVAFNPMSNMLVTDFVRDFKVNYPVGFNDREPVASFLQADPNEALHVPQIVFIDKKGMIRQQTLTRGDSSVATEGNMRKMIQTLLAEPAGAITKKTPAGPRSTKKAS